jgi:glycosyltransferase involved in cell wall biosynthesis
MEISLIICTYRRPKALETLLKSVLIQSVVPDEVLVIDGSRDLQTSKVVETIDLKQLHYYQVSDEHRGLTKQRNYGILKISSTSEIVCFLDDDTVLKENYFEKIVETYEKDPKIIGVGGVAINENRWFLKDPKKTYNSYKYYELDGYIIKEGLRNVVRNYLGLQSPLLPGKMPDFSHGRTYSYPLNNKIYEVDLLVGMSFSFRRKVVEQQRFSTYFEGYGLYEDADYSIRAQVYGKNVISTEVQLYHYHDTSGRPSKYKYGKMVVRNGWYVWRLKYPRPTIKARCKWNSVVLVLAFIRLLNVLTTTKRKEALTEFLGRLVGWITLIFNKPLHK